MRLLDAIIIIRMRPPYLYFYAITNGIFSNIERSPITNTLIWSDDDHINFNFNCLFFHPSNIKVLFHCYLTYENACEIYRSDTEIIRTAFAMVYNRASIMCMLNISIKNCCYSNNDNTQFSHFYLVHLTLNTKRAFHTHSHYSNSFEHNIEHDWNENISNAITVHWLQCAYTYCPIVCKWSCVIIIIHQKTACNRVHRWINTFPLTLWLRTTISNGKDFSSAKAQKLMELWAATEMGSIETNSFTRISNTIVGLKRRTRATGNQRFYCTITAQGINIIKRNNIKMRRKCSCGLIGKEKMFTFILDYFDFSWLVIAECRVFRLFICIWIHFFVVVEIYKHTNHESLSKSQDFTWKKYSALNDWKQNNLSSHRWAF